MATLANENQQSQQHQEALVSKQRPAVLVLGPPTVFKLHEQLFTHQFECIKPWESPIPVTQFLSDDHRLRTIRAVLCSSVFAVKADVLRHLPSLQLIVTASAGLDQIDLPECRRRGIFVASAGTVSSEDVADSALGLLIDVLRRITAADRFVRRGCWPDKGEFPLGSKLGGRQVGIVGLGRIGLEVAKRLEAFGCIISYMSRKKKPSISFPFYADVHELAANCNVLIICCALTDQTRHMINKEVLSALGKEGIIVNIARGAIIDENELMQCLVQGEIAGAGLDVFENEPNVPKELFQLNNVVLSAHRAVFTEDSFWDIYKLSSGNLEAFFSNQPLLSPVVDY